MKRSKVFVKKTRCVDLLIIFLLKSPRPVFFSGSECEVSGQGEKKKPKTKRQLCLCGIFPFIKSKRFTKPSVFSASFPQDAELMLWCLTCQGL